MLKSKIHRATVTGTDLNYVGSITIDADLLEAADILEHEQVHVLDIDNGARFETYTIAGARGSGEVTINGAAARLVHTRRQRHRRLLRAATTRPSSSATSRSVVHVGRGEPDRHRRRRGGGAADMERRPDELGQAGLHRRRPPRAAR